MKIIFGMLFVLLNVGTYLAFIHPVKLEFLGKKKLAILFAILTVFFVSTLFIKDYEYRLVRISFFHFGIYLLGYAFIRFVFGKYLEAGDYSLESLKNVLLKVLLPLMTSLFTATQLLLLYKAGN